MKSAGLKPRSTPGERAFRFRSVAQAFRSAIVVLVLTVLSPGCLQRPTTNPNVLIVGVTSGPNNLDPRIGTDDVSGKTAQ